MDESLTCFEVFTAYKSGKTRTAIITAKDEEDLWRYYDRHYDKDKVEDTCIVDAWPL